MSLGEAVETPVYLSERKMLHPRIICQRLNEPNKVERVHTLENNEALISGIL